MTFNIETIEDIKRAGIMENLTSEQARKILGISECHFRNLYRKNIIVQNPGSGAHSKRFAYDQLKTVKLPRKHKAQNENSQN